MSRIQTVCYNWTEITNKLLHNKQELAKFLKFSAGMYKMSFPDAALVYHQNPNATKIAELETWNKLGRLVNKGERSIAVFGEDNKCRYLFDVTQTNGKRLPELWKLTEDLSVEITDVINKKYGKGCKDIQETIAAMSVDNIRTRLSDMMYAAGQMKLTDENLKAYQQSVVSAVRFIVSNRCELDSNMKISGGINLNAADYFKDTRDLIRFCDLVQKSAKDTLLEMEREIVQILKQRREKSHELQTKPDRAVQSGNTVHGQSAGAGTSENADRQVGQNVAGVGENRVPDRGTDIHSGGPVAAHTQGNRQGGGDTVQGTGRAVQTGEPASTDIQRNSELGKNASADNRTSGDGGNRLSVEDLIDRYKKADFNRRWDSYEIAGWILNTIKEEQLSISPIEHFNKFEAERYSEDQAEEIRSLPQWEHRRISLSL